MIPQKTAKKQPPPTKQNYTVKVDGMTPTTTFYTILAESPEEALKLVLTSNPVDRTVSWGQTKKKKGTVYQMGTHMILLAPREIV